MQIMSLPFWLMIVSRMTAVFHVWRSPMISSRCPRPMGIIESMALIPVCNGSRTGWRSRTPGANFSRGFRNFDVMGPLSSSGNPSGFTTRPISSGPTGTDMIVLVRFTTSPSFNSDDSPSSTAPTSSSSRFSARPKTLCGKRQHLPGHHIFQAMNARDAVADADDCANLVHGNRLLVIRDLFAKYLADFVCFDICHACSVPECLFRGQPRPHLVQPVSHRTVVNRVADPHHRSAEQRRIQRILRLNLFSRQALQRLLQLGFLRRGQFRRRCHFRFRRSLPLPQYVFERLQNFRQQVRPLVVHNNKQKIPHDAARAHPCCQFLDHSMLCRAFHRRVCQNIAQFRGLCIRRAKILQLLTDRPRRALFQRDVRQCRRVLQARRPQFGLPCRLCTKLLIIASCTAGVICFATSDSAPSTARRAANSFNSTRAARSAASISALAAARIFSRSSTVAPRNRSTSAAASRCAWARNSAISRSRLPIFVAASCSLRSASTFAAVAFVIAELILSEFRRNIGGSSFPKTQ